MMACFNNGVVLKKSYIDLGVCISLLVLCINEVEITKLIKVIVALG